MPLNIDFQQIFLHLLNFIILGTGLYVLLYKPVKDFCDKRTDYFNQMEKDAKEKLEAAANLEASYQEKMNTIEDVIHQKQVAAEAVSAKQSETERALAREQADKILADARIAAQSEKNRILSSAGREIAELAAAAADKLVKEALEHEQ